MQGDIAMDNVAEFDQGLNAGEREFKRSGSFIIPWLMLFFIPIGLASWIFIFKGIVAWIF